MPCSRQRQRGASLIAAIFLIVGLAALGLLLARTTALTSEETIAEWYSAQALYAAESGIDYAVHQIVSGSWTTDDPPPSPWAPGTLREVRAGQAWFYVYTELSETAGARLWTITSTGVAGADSANPLAQRRVQVRFLE